MCTAAAIVSPLLFQWLKPLAPDSGALDCRIIAVKPGNAFITADGVELDGLDRFEPSGNIFFTTVALDDSPTFLDWKVADSNSMIELHTWDSLYGNVTSHEHKEYNAFLMLASKDMAVVAALDYLGVEAAEYVGVGFTGIVPGTAADGRLAAGDVIVAVAGRPVSDVQSLLHAMADSSPGMTVVLTVRRYASTDEHPETGDESAGRDSAEDGDGEADGMGGALDDIADAPHVPGAVSEEFEDREEEIVLGAHPETDRGLIGVSGLHAAVQWHPLPFEIDIDSGTVGGPSAGLAFALTVIDVLTPGELTGGLSVAVTGSIMPDGAVGRVSGVRQKADTARRAGADLFIVPEALLAEASEGAGGVPVEGVGSLREAIGVLGEYGGETDGLALSTASP